MSKYYIIASIFILGILPRLVTSQSTQSTEPYFKEKGEIYFRFPNNDKVDIRQLTRIISIDHKTSTEWFYAYANEKSFAQFLDLNISFEILPHPGSLINPKMKDFVDIKATNDWDFYPTYEAYIDLMYQFEQTYPDLCDVFSIGTTVQGRQIMVAKISDNVNVNEKEPRFLYTSTMHGDEATGYILMLRLIEYLLKNFGTYEQVTNLVKNLEIWINPLANPDGTYAGGNNTVCCATRFNANNIDINRNFPDPEDGPHPDGNDWQPETIEFMELADSLTFVMSANFHGGAEVFNYPWDTWAKLHADDKWWNFVGREYADTVHAYAPADYFSDFNNGITNGYEWYSISGGRQDYMNYFHHCREVTIEISEIKMPPENHLPEYWEYNYRSFLGYMTQALYGISGTVTDSESGLPVKAVVTVNNHDIDGSWVTTDSLTGGYFRPLSEGTYSITWIAPKYASQTIEQVSVYNYQQTIQDIQLVYTGSGTADNAYSNLFLISPNPVKENCKITYLGNEIINSRIGITDPSGKLVKEESFIFRPGNNSFYFSAVRLPVGFYLVEISTPAFEILKKIIID